MNLKKLGTLVIAIIMTMTVGLAFAATTDATWNDYNGVESTDNTIGIAKEIVFVNAESTTVREPNITYTYTIASATPGSAKITGVDEDNNAMTLPVNAGPIAAVSSTTATVVFADTATQSATSAGANSTTKYANFTFTPTPATFGAPGIYRYSITEEANPAKATVGITEPDDYVAERFLDVYVHWTDDAHTTLGIYGYVLFEGTATDSIEYNDSDDLAQKSKGYVNTATSGQADVDVYTTQNLEISKVTTGALADKNHDFPVTITFTKASGLTDGIKLDYTVSGNGVLTKVGTDTNSVDYVTMDNALSGTVRNGSTITITGIPTSSTVTMTEKNDTADFYRVKAGTAADGADLLAEAVVNNGATSGATDDVTIADAKKEIHFTNTLSEISPTGVVLRFAPYALMLAAGIVLLVLSKKRRSSKED